MYFKKYIEKNNIIGKKVSTEVKLYSIEESKKEGFAYEATAILLDANRVAGKTLMIHIYSNNDQLLSLNKDSIYKVNGKVSKLESNSLLSQCRYEIEE